MNYWLKSISSSEFFKYLIVGGFAFSCDFSTLYISTEIFGLHYLVSGFFGYCVGLSISYVLNVRWVFKFRKYDKKLIEFSIFNVIVIIGLLFNEIIIYLAVNNFEVNYLYGKLVAGFVIFAFNYSAKKFFLFHKKEQS